ncbi:HNH endonuclease [Arthrobacter sp. TB 23]|uniref:HNH endonuclease n=1 Tax=Arthrobacter sp. TB 23 TaxID=494419 RepID=UPI001ED97526|nr:HNH endonuclease [Arthrobacter sp. TB 23]
MTAIMLGWNPDLREGWQFAYSAVQDAVHDAGFASVRWPAVVPPVPPGSDVWLVLQGANERGLFGHGTVVTTPDDGGLLDVDLLLPRGEHIPEAVLFGRVPGLPFDDGAAVLTVDHEQLLRAVWADYAPSSENHPVDPTAGTLPASALLRSRVNRYEHDPEAHRQSIAHHGSSCAVCHFNFEETYGTLGAGFIQVHHIVPGPQLTADYVLDPLTDLVPMCANCHAMAHRRAPNPYSPAELRRLIRPSSHLEGSVVDPVEQRAQEDAARILRSSSGPVEKNPDPNLSV